MRVFITGASSGIGEACAREFAKGGASLVLTARRKEKLETLAAELRQNFGVAVDVYALDVTQPKQIERVVAATLGASAEKPVDVLLNNAGLALGIAPFQEGVPEDWDTVVQTNLLGLMRLTHAFLPSFLSRKSGHIVNLGSVAGRWTYPNGAVYCASKFAVKGFTESLRMDLHGSGIRVTEIAPGMVETEFSAVRLKGDLERAQAVYAGMTPLTPEDIAEAVVWAVQRPSRVNIQEIVLFPTDQASIQMVHRSAKLTAKN
jgi:3-hydroxy acid dehydrogenase/malonic semialdehyde reductase